MHDSRFSVWVMAQAAVLLLGAFCLHGAQAVTSVLTCSTTVFSRVQFQGANWTIRAPPLTLTQSPSNSSLWLEPPSVLMSIWDFHSPAQILAAGSSWTKGPDDAIQAVNFTCTCSAPNCWDQAQNARARFYRNYLTHITGAGDFDEYRFVDVASCTKTACVQPYPVAGRMNAYSSMAMLLNYTSFQPSFLFPSPTSKPPSPKVLSPPKAARSPPSNATAKHPPPAKNVTHPPPRKVVKPPPSSNSSHPPPPARVVHLSPPPPPPKSPKPAPANQTAGRRALAQAQQLIKATKAEKPEPAST